MSRIALVTGASGFLGGYIVPELISSGWSVTGLDRGSSKNPVAGHIRCELPSPMLTQILLDLRPDLLVHAAGSASVPASLTDPGYDFRHSAETVFGVLDAVRNASPGTRVVLLSSAAVYGDPPTLPIAETAPTSPLSPYGFHKLICEQLMTEFSKVYGLNTCSARIFSAYGAGLARQVIWDICGKASASLNSRVPVELFGTGAESRDFIHAADVAHGISLIAQNATFEGETYNLATGVETRISEVATDVIGLISERSGRNMPELSFSGEARTGDPVRWRADISRISALGFKPGTNLMAGLSQYVDWYLKRGTNEERST